MSASPFPQTNQQNKIAMSSESPASLAPVIDCALKLGRSETARAQLSKIGNLDVLIDRDGRVTSLEKFADSPRRKRAHVTFYEAKSFIAYVVAHLLPGRTLITGTATELGGHFAAIIDYHGEEPRPVNAETAPATTLIAETTPAATGNGEHTARLNLSTTPEWARWLGQNGKLLPQETFAEFIEDNLADIVRPDAATILEFAQGLQGKKEVSFKSGRNLRDGSIQLEYVEAVTVQGSTTRRDDSFKLPDRFTLGLVPFVGANGVEIEARLRFRIGTDGKLSFAFLLNRPYKLIEQAFEATRADIETGTGRPVLLGTAEIKAAA